MEKDCVDKVQCPGGGGPYRYVSQGVSWVLYVFTTNTSIVFMSDLPLIRTFGEVAVGSLEIGHRYRGRGGLGGGSLRALTFINLSDIRNSKYTYSNEQYIMMLYHLSDFIAFSRISIFFHIYLYIHVYIYDAYTRTSIRCNGFGFSCYLLLVVVAAAVVVVIVFLCVCSFVVVIVGGGGGVGCVVGGGSGGSWWWWWWWWW